MERNFREVRKQERNFRDGSPVHLRGRSPDRHRPGLPNFVIAPFTKEEAVDKHFDSMRTRTRRRSTKNPAAAPQSPRKQRKVAPQQGCTWSFSWPISD
jgi:hypothetical protein